MEIGSHGWSHRDLNLCRENEQTEEIGRSRQELEAILGERIQAFAYPYGNYASRHFQSLAQAGYQGAVSIASAARSVTGNAFAMRRACLQPRDEGLRFRLKLSRLYWRYRAWRDPVSL
jgi:peptidoglycan/xylan/chitin deacetylase (PgdA/CDA1 family)